MYLNDPDVELHQGDALEVLRTLPCESVDCCVTDPPYSETSLMWDVRPSAWLAGVDRVLKPSGSVWVFGSLRSFMAAAGDFHGWRHAWDVMTDAERRSWLHLARAAVEAYEGSQQLGLLERADGWWR
ncbi:MAG: hypothetical protein HY323_05395 [Betaproteobacteria bacterium]|nr:hypothetical protein [Betaproteobacteria bacterium]